MQVGIITLFPEMFDAIIKHGITSRAIQNGLLSISCWNPRDFTFDKHKTVDDRPYGGGPGMLMMVQPLKDAIAQAKTHLGNDTKVIYLSPQGRKFDQQAVNEFVIQDKFIFICGRYEGIDERLIQAEVDEEWSIGDFVLTGGELAAMTMIDAISRFIPGVLNHQHSALEDSFATGLLDCPHYTRPEVLDGVAVPEVLLSGHHEEIRRWRLKQSLGRTWLRREDLLLNLALTEEETALLNEFKHDYLKETD